MIVILGFIVFLLGIYLFTREDFIFMRRSVSVEQLFDAAFMNALVALLLARVIFVALHFKTTYLNPLVFFVIPYFPGLGLSGAILGSFFFLLWLSRSQKIPTGHLLDVFSASFFYAFSTTLLGYSVITLIQRQFLVGIVDGIWSIISFALSILLGSILMKSVWKDGSLTAVVVVAISVIILITRGSIMFLQKPLVLDKELVLFLFILLAAGVMGIGKKFMQRSAL